MKNILARGGIEFLAVFLGIGLSLWIDETQKSKDAEELNYQILNRLYDNLEADSIDGVWNYKAHDTVVRGSERVLLWCNNEQPNSDSIDIFLSSLGIATVFVNNMEEYNALKSSGRMELIKDEVLVKFLHDYYTKVAWVKSGDKAVQDYVMEQFIPFMADYSDYYGLDKSRNVYDNTFPVFHLLDNPPKEKLSYHASMINTNSMFISAIYKDLVSKVTAIRRMIRIEIKQ